MVLVLLGEESAFLVLLCHVGLHGGLGTGGIRGRHGGEASILSWSRWCTLNGNADRASLYGFGSAGLSVEKKRVGVYATALTLWISWEGVGSSVGGWGSSSAGT